MSKKFISFSGGVESTTMCVLFGNVADAVFADTGGEHKEIYERIQLVEKWCQKFHRSDFKIHLVKNNKYGTLTEYIKEQKFFPSFKARYCTRMFKIEPIDDFLTQFKNEGVSLMIGLNYDEVNQRIGNHGNKKFVSYEYPLVDKLLNREACKRILKKVGLLPNFPSYMKRGGCKYCYYKSLKEYEAMALLNPEEFEEVEKLENEIQDKREDFFSILPNKKMSDIRESVSNMIFKPHEIYPVVNDATNCGVFCNR